MKERPAHSQRCAGGTGLGGYLPVCVAGTGPHPAHAAEDDGAAAAARTGGLVSGLRGAAGRAAKACRMPCAAGCERNMEDMAQVPENIQPLLMLSGCCPSALAQLLEEGDIVYAAE